MPVSRLELIQYRVLHVKQLPLTLYFMLSVKTIAVQNKTSVTQSAVARYAHDEMELSFPAYLQQDELEFNENFSFSGLSFCMHVMQHMTTDM